MNTVILIGRLTKEPDMKNDRCQYTLAVDRAFKKGEADFIQCVVFGKSAEFAHEYFHKGMKIAVQGRIQTGSFQTDGQTKYYTNVVVDRQEFCESKSEKPDIDGFMSVPKGIDEELPFN